MHRNNSFLTFCFNALKKMHKQAKSTEREGKYRIQSGPPSFLLSVFLSNGKCQEMYTNAITHKGLQFRVINW